MYYDLDLSLINRTYLLTGGSLEITPTVPLTVVFIRGAVTKKLF